jgi:hypothetical protein
MKPGYFSILIMVAVFISSLYSCGTTGHIKFYYFDASKKEVEKRLKEIINQDSLHIVPSKWKEHTMGDYFERYYVYFSNSPEEMYQIGFTGDSSDWKNANYSKLGLICVYAGEQFEYENDLSYREIKRIEKRFEEEILSRLDLIYKSE